MELYRKNLFFAKTPVPESLFNKVTDRSLSSEAVALRNSVKEVF